MRKTLANNAWAFFEVVTTLNFIRYSIFETKQISIHTAQQVRNLGLWLTKLIFESEFSVEELQFGKGRKK